MYYVLFLPNTAGACLFLVCKVTEKENEAILTSTDDLKMDQIRIITAGDKLHFTRVLQLSLKGRSITSFMCLLSTSVPNPHTRISFLIHFFYINLMQYLTEEHQPFACTH